MKYLGSMHFILIIFIFMAVSFSKCNFYGYYGEDSCKLFPEGDEYEQDTFESESKCKKNRKKRQTQCKVNLLLLSQSGYNSCVAIGMKSESGCRSEQSIWILDSFMCDY